LPTSDAPRLSTLNQRQLLSPGNSQELDGIPSVFRPSRPNLFPEKTPSRFPGKTTLPHPDNPLSRQNIGKKGLPLSGQNLFLRLTHLPDKIPLHHPIPTTAPAKPAPPHTGIPFCRKPSPQPAIFPKYVNRRFSVKIISIYYP